MNIKRFIFNPFGESTYIVWDEATKQAAVIDPGMSNSAEQQLFDMFVADNNLTIAQIINTHLHLDHCWGNNYIKKQYNATTAANADDLFLGERTAAQAKMFGIPYGELAPVTIDTELIDGDVLHIGNCEFRVLAVPGHSPGSIALYNATNNCAFVGDALFCGSIGRTDLPGGNHQQLIGSIRNKLFALPDSTKVYPGHEATTTIGQEKNSNPFV